MLPRQVLSLERGGPEKTPMNVGHKKCSTCRGIASKRGLFEEAARRRKVEMGSFSSSSESSVSEAGSE